MSKVASPTTLPALALVCIVMFRAPRYTHPVGSRRGVFTQRRERDAGIRRLERPWQQRSAVHVSQFCSTSCRGWQCALFPIVSSRSARPRNGRACARAITLWLGAPMLTVEVARPERSSLRRTRGCSASLAARFSTRCSRCSCSARRHASRRGAGPPDAVVSIAVCFDLRRFTA